MKLFSDRTYRAIRFTAYLILRIAHPIVRIRGRENVEQGAAVVVANHSSFSDVVWAHAGANFKKRPMTMAKKELFNIFLVSKIFLKLGAFPVDREGNDIQAIKTSLKCLSEDNKLVIFPEGTRVRTGEMGEVHNGAMMLACRAKVPILPIYVTAKKRFLRPIDIVIGEPYLPQYEGKKPTAEDLDRLSDEMMQKIYQMGAKQ